MDGLSNSGVSFFDFPGCMEEEEESTCRVVDCPNVKVAVRIRPMPKDDPAPPIIAKSSSKVVSILKPGKEKAYLRSQQPAKHDYTFDVAFGPDSHQEEIFDNAVAPLIDKVLTQGINGAVFAYGATGAGKTHTMLGTAECPGIIPLCLQQVFTELSIRELPCHVSISYLEVYNENIRDLLCEKSKVCEVQEDSTEVRVSNLAEIPVQDAQGALALLQKGNRTRRVEATAANKTSSRSHAVFQINIHLLSPTPPSTSPFSPLLSPPPPPEKHFKINLIDLAGSERASVTQNKGSMLREGAAINRSLLALANCINSLAGEAAERVKYRDSKLTHLLKNSLEGYCSLVMIANVHPGAQCYEESHNTLKYANRAKNIKTNQVPLAPPVVAPVVAPKRLSVMSKRVSTSAPLNSLSSQVGPTTAFVGPSNTQFGQSNIQAGPMNTQTGLSNASNGVSEMMSFGYANELANMGRDCVSMWEKNVSTPVSKRLKTETAEPVSLFFPELDETDQEEKLRETLRRVELFRSTRRRPMETEVSRELSQVSNPRLEERGEEERQERIPVFGASERHTILERTPVASPCFTFKNGEKDGEKSVCDRSQMESRREDCRVSFSVCEPARTIASSTCVETARSASAEWTEEFLMHLKSQVDTLRAENEMLHQKLRDETLLWRQQVQEREQRVKFLENVLIKKSAVSHLGDAETENRPPSPVKKSHQALTHLHAKRQREPSLPIAPLPSVPVHQKLPPKNSQNIFLQNPAQRKKIVKPQRR